MQYFSEVGKKSKCGIYIQWQILCRFKKGRQFCHLHKCFLIHFDDKSVGVEFIKPESGIVVYGLCGGGKTEVLFKGFKVSIVQDQLVLEICRMM